MKKISFILFSVFLILFFNSIVPAQSIKVGVGGGLTSVQGPDSYTNDISQNEFGFSSEYNLGAIAAGKGNKEKAREIWTKLVEEYADDEIGIRAKKSIEIL